MKKELNWVTKVFGGLAALLLLVVIMAAVFPLVPPFRNYFHTRSVLTGSMGKAIPTGALIINHFAEDRDLKVGNVITFHQPGTTLPIFITHRIVSIDRSGPLYFFQTKGDANPTPDGERISPVSIEGKVIAVIPYLGYLVEALKIPVVFVVLVFIPLSLFILSQLRDAWRLWKGMSSEKGKGDTTKLGQKVVVSGLLFLLLQATLLQRIYAAFLSSQAQITDVTLATLGAGPSPSPTATPISTPTPTPTPTQAPSPTVTPSPTRSPSPSPSSAGNCIISQSNTIVVTTTVSSSASTGGNSADGNTGGSVTVTSGNASSSASVSVQGSSNSVNCGDR